jgi:hypothetical protein
MRICLSVLAFSLQHRVRILLGSALWPRKSSQHFYPFRPKVPSNVGPWLSPEPRTRARVNILIHQLTTTVKTNKVAIMPKHKEQDTPTPPSNFLPSISKAITTVSHERNCPVTQKGTGSSCVCGNKTILMSGKIKISSIGNVIHFRRHMGCNSDSNLPFSAMRPRTLS